MFEILNECSQMLKNSKTQSFRMTYAVNSKMIEEIFAVCAYMNLCILCGQFSWVVFCIDLVFPVDQVTYKQSQFSPKFLLED